MLLVGGRSLIFTAVADFDDTIHVEEAGRSIERTPFELQLIRSVVVSALRRDILRDEVKNQYASGALGIWRRTARIWKYRVFTLR